MMIKLVLLLATAIQVYCDEPEAIVDGTNATPGQFPYQVSLQINGKHICGGSIISSRHIVTAAHCVELPGNDLTVVSGITALKEEGQRHEIECIQIHPNYNATSPARPLNDIALITLKKPIEFNNIQQPIPLASRNYNVGALRGIISGWGKTSISSPPSAVLQWLQVNVLSQGQCLSVHGNPRTNVNHICTILTLIKGLPLGACQGDSGALFVINGELAGVVSWDVPCAMGYPDVFTNVYMYRDFIEQSQSKC